MDLKGNRWLYLGLCLLGFVAAANSQAKAKHVRISLDAKWKAAHLVTEASEFMATKDNDYFWQFCQQVCVVSTYETESDQYDFLVDVASNSLLPLDMDLLKFSLSTRTFSPKIAAYQQIAEEHHPPSDCTSFVVINDTVICTLSDAMMILDKNQPMNVPVVYPFDHIYPGLGESAYTNSLVLYADLGTDDFLSWHTSLSRLCKQKEFRYIFRHFIAGDPDRKVALSGYGVELAVKSTEYTAVDDQKASVEGASKTAEHPEDNEDEVEGFLFSKLRKHYPDLDTELTKFYAYLKESTKEMAPMKAWQLQDLSMQAAQRITSSTTKEALGTLKDLSQNFPMIARSLSKTHVTNDLRAEIKKNQEVFERQEIQPGDSALFINGLRLPISALEPFSLITTLQSEAKSLEKLDGLGLEGEAVGRLLSLNLKNDNEELSVDMRSSAVQWINDLESDRQYAYWPTDLNQMLRPTFPGMLRYVAKNIFHVVFVVDPLDAEGIKLIKMADELIQQSVPARIGLVFVTGPTTETSGKKDAGIAITRAFSFIKSDKGVKDAMEFVMKVYRSASGTAPEPQDVMYQFKRWYSTDDANDVMGADSEYDDMRKDANVFFKRTGLKTTPQITMNGIVFSKEEIKILETSLVEKIIAHTPFIQQGIYTHAYAAYPTMFDYVMEQPNVVKRLNSIVQGVDNKVLSFSDQPLPKSLGSFGRLSPDVMASALAADVKYFTSDKGAVTMWLFCDAETKTGRQMLRSSLNFIRKSKSTRLGVFLVSNEQTGVSLNHLVQIIIDIRNQPNNNIAKYLAKVLDESNDFAALKSNFDLVLELSEGISGFNRKKLRENFDSEKELKRVSEILSNNKIFSQTVLNLKYDETTIVSNSRVLGPISGNDVFTEDDVELLESVELKTCAFKVQALVDEMEFSSLPPDGHGRFRSDIVMKVAGTLSERTKEQRHTFEFAADKYSVIHLQPKRRGGSFDVVAVVDPLTTDAQKLAPFLMVLHNVTNVNLRVFLNSKAKLSEAPLKRFYRYVLEPEVMFDAASQLKGSQAVFHNMPVAALLTLNMDTPQSWMIEAVRSNYDLDNINLAGADQDVFGDFALEYILVEGNCAESATGSPPRGLQFIMGTRLQPAMFDTIVMANLGYFQLKAYPGLFNIQLREGRSSQIYTVASMDGATENNKTFSLIIDNFQGKLLSVKVDRKAGEEKADLLAEDDDDKGIWDSITSYVSKDKKVKESDDTIHIFSVATGQLYERFLRVMMLSVIKTTKSPVKFWFLKNFLSATFTSFLPHMAKEYNFEFELVQYQWPRWLNRQHDKQRIIWGYKILFLDVLFPLNLKKVIFVDADQIVRTDLKELMEMDLGGAPYAYTPFCDDRKDMDGFRFWKQGYWNMHLAGRPYHISALYVVDLKRFRRIAAGDRLRGQYQGLSQDPNSLANLDQDLPNNMIHQVEIKSLPQDWLWCETWCSDESKKTAKTIDLCNNPQTKEPKLDRAFRIVKEWPILDEEIRNLQEQIAKAKTPTHHKDRIREQKAKQEDGASSTASKDHQEL